MPIYFASGRCFREFRINHFALLDCKKKKERKKCRSSRTSEWLLRVFGGDVLVGRSRLTAEWFPRAFVIHSQYRADVASSPEWDSFLVWCEVFSVWYHPLVSFVCDLYCVCGALHAELSSTYVLRYVPIVYAYLVWRFALNKRLLGRT